MFLVEAGAEDFVGGGDRNGGNEEANEGDLGFEVGHSSDDHEDATRLPVVTDNCDVTPEVKVLTLEDNEKKKVSMVPRFDILVHLSLKNDFHLYAMGRLKTRLNMAQRAESLFYHILHFR